MELKEFVIRNYPVARPYNSVGSIKDRLLEQQYLVVLDDSGVYCGILSVADVVDRQHKTVHACMSDKERLNTEDSITHIFDKFISNKSCALPVFNNNSFEGVIVDNHISRTLEERILRSDERSEILEKTKEYYLNNLSHEIRTPLNGIIGFLDILAYFDIDDSLDEIQEISDVIKKSAKRFLQLMDDLVALSLLYSGSGYHVDKEEVNVAKILADLQNSFHELPLFENNKASIKYTNTDLYVSVVTDERKLRSILYHLIDNAIKFSDNNEAEFGFDCSPEGETITFFVRNEGHVADRDIEQMFGYFEKQKKVGPELNPGLGIGLPLVKHFTQLLGGHIYLELKDRQITFYVTIPLA